DALGLACVEEAQLGVRAGGGALDPAEPACNRDGDSLARDREIRDRLGCLRAPELLPDAGVAHGFESSSRAFASRASQVACFTRGRPCSAPRARSWLSIASQPSYSMKSTFRSRRR